jgi:hypothetical protein
MPKEKEAKQVSDKDLLKILAEVYNTPGECINIVEYRRNLAGGGQVVSGSDKDSALLIEWITPQHLKRQDLEKEFKECPEYNSVEYKNGKEVRTSEWITIFFGIRLGTKSTWGQYGEMERTWYLRNTFKGKKLSKII